MALSPLKQRIFMKLFTIQVANFPGTPTEFQNISFLKETNQGLIFSAQVADTNETIAIKVADAQLVRKHLSIQNKHIPEDFLTETTNTLYIAEKMRNDPSFHSIIRGIESWDETDYNGQVLCHCMTLEFIPGGKDLFDIGAQVWTQFNQTRDSSILMPWFSRVQDMFRQMAKGLETLHTHGVVHLDFSPENILVDENDHIRIIDFGTSMLCRSNDDDDEEICDDDFRFRGFRGKRPYVAPEVFTREYDGRAADVFSLGAVLLFLLGGVADERRVHLNRVMKKGMRPLLRRWGRDCVPAEGVDLIEKLLVLEPDRLSMDELKKHPYVVDVADLEEETFGVFSLDMDGFHSSEEVVVHGKVKIGDTSVPLEN